MIYTKDHKTLDMFNPFAHLGPKRLKMMEQSWAQLFRDEILPELPVHKIADSYDSLKGRPTKELYAMLGLMILQQMEDLTDQEAVNQFAFNIQWHYALNITSEADSETYVSPKTLWTMRRLLTERNLYTPIFEVVTEKLAKLFSVNTDKQRIDSVHICSNMRYLGRIGLFVQTIKKFLVNLKRHHKEAFAALGKDFTDRFLSKRAESAFAMVKPSETVQTLQTLSVDLLFLVRRFSTDSAITGMSSYQLLIRLLKEQCMVEQGATTQNPKVSVKPNKEVPSDSLQNPSDPDATYDGHKGKGYQVQVMETYSRDEDEEQLNLITYVSAEPAHNSDLKALIPAIEDTKKRGMAPKELLADSLYGSDDNCRDAKEIGTTVVAPVMGRTAKKDLAQFTFSKEWKATACPQGHAPLKTKHKKDRHSASFDSKNCVKCPHLSSCPVKPGKSAHYLNYAEKAARMAKRKAHESSPEFFDKYRFRAGAEATMSQYDRKTGVKQLRVRGLKAVSFCAALKAAGINILRATAFKNRKPKRAEAEKLLITRKLRALFAQRAIIKEQLPAILPKFAKMAGMGHDLNQSFIKIAA